MRNILDNITILNYISLKNNKVKCRGNEMKEIIGVYMLLNKNTNQCYIGSSKDHRLYLAGVPEYNEAHKAACRKWNEAHRDYFKRYYNEHKRSC